MLVPYNRMVVQYNKLSIWDLGFVLCVGLIFRHQKEDLYSSVRALPFS